MSCYGKSVLFIWKVEIPKTTLACYGRVKCKEIGTSNGEKNSPVELYFDFCFKCMGKKTTRLKCTCLSWNLFNILLTRVPFITLTIVALLVSEALKIIVILFQVSKKQTDGTVVSLLIAPMCLYDKLLPSFKEKTNLYPSAWLSFLKTNLKPCKKFDEDILRQNYSSVKKSRAQLWFLGFSFKSKCDLGFNMFWSVFLIHSRRKGSCFIWYCHLRQRMVCKFNGVRRRLL